MPNPDRIRITALKVPCIIGIFDWERKKKQNVLIDLSFPCDTRRSARTDRIEDAVDYKRIAKATLAYVSTSRFQLVESLAERLAAHLLEDHDLTEITLKVSKPGALRHSANVGVEITRQKNEGRAVFSLGSNLDKRLHLTRALEAFRSRFSTLTVSSVYETAPVGLKRQPFFWNLVVACPASEGPTVLRHWASSLEKQEGRTRRGPKAGPRTLDVDLIDHPDRRPGDRKHSLPHPDIAAKAFVLFPFLEIQPNWTDPFSGLTLVEMAAAFHDPRQRIKRLADTTL